jgi:hypothetical protein
MDSRPDGGKHTVKRSLVLALLLASCAGVGTRSGGVLLSMRPQPAGQRCYANVPPVRVAGLDELVDSTGLAGRMEDAERSSQGHAIFIAGTDSLGAPGSVRIVERSLPEPVAHRIADALHAMMRPQLPSERGWGVLVRVDVADSIRWRIGRQEECPPALANRREIQRSLREGLEKVVVRDPGARRVLSTDEARSLTMRVFIDSLGAVQNAEPLTILQHRALDSLAMSIARQFRFHPALLNRQPVPVWIQIPIGFQLSPPAAADSARGAAGA